ncbi:MAG TPA: hypothetical protein VNS34_27000 [Rhizobiaceae bacterium]|nr:hypothetical protein [Rhizobiaceae bacterium]
MRSPDPHQDLLFGELIENLWTPDQPFEAADGSFGTMAARPPGAGWRIADYRKDRKTLWQRRLPIVSRPRRATKGEGWRQ